MPVHPELTSEGTAGGCLAGGGEMGAFMRALDWSSTLLGPLEQWPQSLRTSVSTCLNSRFAILIWWGPDMVMLYNDAYRDIIAAKHPAALGHPGRECWPEIWHIIGPMLEGVLQRGEATWSTDLLLLLERRGYPEECYFTFSYSPIRDENGRIAGVFTPVAETTERVIGERRLRTLRDLATRAATRREVHDACEAAIETLGSNPYDVPFAALYLVGEEATFATLAGVAGIDKGSVVTPLSVSDMPEPLVAAFASSRLTFVEEVAATLGPLPGGAWDTPTHSLVVVPLLVPGEARAGGYILAGVNPRKHLDSDYRTFFELVGGQVSTALVTARAYEQERRRADALAEIDRAKTLFFSNVSHEFRTPLTLMLGPLEAILERAHPSTEVTAAEVGLVHRNGMRLLKLVNTLLDFSRIEAGRAQAVYEPTDLAAVTAEIASAFRSAMDQADLEFIIDCAPLAEPAWVDRDMWEKIVLNLISNAFKFTLSGSVAVRLEDTGNSVLLAVADTGVGIPEKELGQVFDRFHRVEGARGRTHEGSGIGLAFVQELVKLHGGSIQVASTLGQGSAFTVSIPKGREHLPAERIGSAPILRSAQVAASAYVDEALRWLPETSRPPHATRLFASDSVQAPHETTGGRILLCEDNVDMRAYIRRLLGDHYDVEMAPNGIEALTSARASPPDLVLTDVMMPGLDGFGLLRELRASESTSTIPVILLSARAGEDARIEGLEAGADDYLVKPFTARELLARVGAHLALSRLRRETAAREKALRTEAETARERNATLLDSISDAFMALDEQWCFTYINAEAERSLEMPRDELIGKSIWDLFPMVRETAAEENYRRAMIERIPMRFEFCHMPWKRWFEIRAYPARDGGLSIFYQEITQRKRTEEEMHKANLALESANADLEQFAYSATHDLKEPLRTVRACCQLLSRTYAGRLSADADELIGYCVDGAGRMDALLNALVDYLRAGMAGGPVEVVPLDPSLDEALLNLRSAIEETGAMVTRDPLPSVAVAPVHAQQIFQNLIGNALKYRSTAPPEVRVSARKEGVEWIFSVRDNGIGIGPEYLSQVFGLFNRLHAGREYAGTGIGLAICRKLVERYGGRIWVESEAGRGSTFSFSIPEPG